jgi:hypothetical protein
VLIHTKGKNKIKIYHWNTGAKHNRRYIREDFRKISVENYYFQEKLLAKNAKIRHKINGVKRTDFLEYLFIKYFNNGSPKNQ